MAMIKKLTKHGNSWALIIDKPVLELLNIDPEAPLEVSTDGQTLIISPAATPERRAKFEAALKKANRKFGPALKRLAK
jgi:antitoxin MazE